MKKNTNIKNTINYKVGVIIENNNRFLLKKKSNTAFYTLIWNTCDELNSKNIIIKEIKEELNYDIEEDLNLVETLFDDSERSVTYIYKLKFNNEPELCKKNDFFVLNNHDERLYWLHKNAALLVPIIPKEVVNIIK